MAAAGLRPDPVDAAPAMVAAARARGLPARRATFEDWGTGPYEGVWANFSLLHAPREDLPGHLSRLAGALVPGGVLALGMKTGEGAARDGLGRLYTYVGEAELAGWLTAAGLAIAETRTGSEEGLAGTEDPFILILARKPD